MNSRVFQLLVVLVVVVFCISGAMAAEVHQAAFPLHAKVVARNVHRNTAVPPAAGVYGEAAEFIGSPYADSWITLNGDNSALWPCFGGSTDASGDGAKADCEFAGDPQQYLPYNAMVTGVPSYTWDLTACDQTSTSSPLCGQASWQYEDDTGDSVDDLTVYVQATQGTATVLNNGTYDVGPNALGYGAALGYSIIWSDPTGLGTMGQTGKNNGNCTPDIGYPLTSPSFPGAYLVSAGKTCVAPTQGVVAWEIITEWGTPVYTKQTTASKCPGVGAPCYTVAWTSKYKLTQKFNTYLEDF